MRFPFDEEKATQVAGYLLKLSGGTVEYLMLIKLMYLADKEMLVKHGKTLTGDELVSMEHGPVLSHIYNLIKDGSFAYPDDSEWFAHIERSGQYKVNLTSDPGTEALSAFEIGVLDKVFKQYGKMNRFELVKLLHDILPEWNSEVGKSSSPIEPETILRNEHWTDDEIADAKASADEARFFAALG